MCPREWDQKFGSVKHGSGIIRRTSGGSYVAEVNRDARRQRKTFPGITGARGWIDSLLATRDRLGRKATALTDRQLTDAQDALHRLHVGGLNVSLRAAADFYLKHHQAEAESWTVKECFDRQLADMRDPASGASPARPRSILSKSSRLSSFVEMYGAVKIVQITRADVEAWLRETKAKGTTLRNFKIEIQTLFNFAARRMPGNYVNTVARFERSTKREVTPAAIVRPDQLSAVLHRMEQRNPSAALGVALGAFCGLRTEEVAGPNGIDWQDVDWAEKRIVVRANIAKGRVVREVKIPDNLLAWLMKYRAESGRISVSKKLLAEERGFACREAGVTWPANAARHSFATYLARLTNYQEAASALGHLGSIQLFMRFYSGRCTTAQAGEWFEIRPAEAGKVITMQQTHSG